MDQGSYTFDSLAKKHDNFLAPSFEIQVNGKELPQGKYHIPGVEVEISASGTVGGCTFSIAGQYDYQNKKWLNDASTIIKPGVKITVLGGYSKSRTELFHGYVDDYSLQFDQEGTPSIKVNGLDGLGYLMNMCQPFYAGEKQPKQIVESVLQKCQAAGYAKKIHVGQLTGFETPIIKEQMDDWKFLQMMAERYGSSLFAIDGELIFDNVLTKTSPILTLTMNKSLRSFTRRVSLAHQIGKVEIFGRDVNQKAIQGSASTVTAGGEGKTAAEWVTGLKDAVLRERNEYVRTQKECEILAQNRLNSIAMGFVSGEGECVGIPELIPGRYLKIDGGDDLTNGTYFITKVFHRFTASEYTTRFEVKGAKA